MLCDTCGAFPGQYAVRTYSRAGLCTVVQKGNGAAFVGGPPFPNSP